MNNFATATDCQRLLNAQPLLDSLVAIDSDTTAANLRGELVPSLDALLDASIVIAHAGLNHLLSTVRCDIATRLPRCPQSVQDAATHAAFAAAFGDILDTETLAALSLPWALGAVTVIDDELAAAATAVDADFDADLDEDESFTDWAHRMLADSDDEDADRA